jgi:O-antigen/teichoic acid export membrane protein
MGAVSVGVAAQGTLVISGILSARLLGATDRGYLALLTTIPSTIAQIGGVGFSLAATYFIARDRRAARAVISLVRMPALVQVGGLTVVHAAVIAALSGSKLRDVIAPAVVSIAMIPSLYALEYGLAFLQGAHRYRLFNVLRLAPSVFYGAYVAALYVAGVDSVALLILGSSVPLGVAGLWGIRAAVVSATSNDAPERVPARGDVLRFGLRSYLGHVSPLESFRLDQLYIGAVLPPAALGLYVVGTAFTTLARFVGQSIGLIAAPHIAGQPDQSVQRRNILRFFGLAVALCGGITAVLVVAVGPLIPLLFGRAFTGAIGVSRILLVGAFFLAIRRVLTDSARGFGLPSLGSIAEFASILLFAPLVVLLKSSSGLEGVAVAFSAAAAFGFVILVLSYARALRNGGVPGERSYG